MKKIIWLLLICFTLTGCAEKKTDYSIILNRGSMFVYTFKDPVTNVWYISGKYGLSPRLNQDGSLYVK